MFVASENNHLISTDHIEEFKCHFIVSRVFIEPAE